MDVDGAEPQELVATPCNKCGADTYAASLVCDNCKATWPACIASGFPIRDGGATIKCNNCGNVADREAWNEFVTKFGFCPWCGAKSHVEY